MPPPGPGPYCGTRANNTGGMAQVAMHGIPLANFVRNLSGVAGRFVVDRTGLTGPFELELKFSQDSSVGATAPSEHPSLFAALEEQLGLKLEPQRGPVPVLVIESAERPRED